MPRLALTVGLAVAAIAVAALGHLPSSARAATRPADRLWNRGFVATAIDADGPTPFRQPPQITIFFYAEGWYPDAIQWTLPCYSGELPARIGRHRIWTGRPKGRWDHLHCSRGSARRVRWLIRFFRAAPRWRLVDGRLSLTTSRSVIRLRRAHVLYNG